MYNQNHVNLSLYLNDECLLVWQLFLETEHKFSDFVLTITAIEVWAFFCITFGDCDQI